MGSVVVRDVTREELLARYEALRVEQPEATEELWAMSIPKRTLTGTLGSREPRSGHARGKSIEKHSDLAVRKRRRATR